MSLEWLKRLDDALRDAEWQRPEDSTTVSEMQEATGKPYRTCHDQLNSLVRRGVLTRRKLGREYIYFEPDSGD